MIKIDKHYVIRFSYGGIAQYASFYEVEGKLYDPTFSVQYAKSGEIPSVKDVETIEEALAIIKQFSYGNNTKIYKINGLSTNYYHNTKVRAVVNGSNKIYTTFRDKFIIGFFEEVLEPIMQKNKWFLARSHMGVLVLISKNEDDEWDNIPNDILQEDFEYICSQIASIFNIDNSKGGVNRLFNHIPYDYLIKRNYYIENP